MSSVNEETSAVPVARPQRSRAVIVVIGVAVLALLGLVIALTRSEDPAVSARSAGGAGVCGLAPGSQAIPSSKPEATWELVGKMAAPASEAVGPGRRAGVRSCFARSPSGALFATVNVMASLSEEKLRNPAARELTASGEGKDFLLRELATAGPDDPAYAGTSTQVAGYRFLNYSQDLATVDIAVRVGTSSGGGGLLHLPFTMRWESGDWKLVLLPDGNSATVYTLTDLAPAGFIPWAGV